VPGGGATQADRSTGDKNEVPGTFPPPPEHLGKPGKQEPGSCDGAFLGCGSVGRCGLDCPMCGRGHLWRMEDRAPACLASSGEVTPVTLPQRPAALRLSARVWRRGGVFSLDSAVEWLKRNRCGRNPWSTANPRTRHSGTASIALRGFPGGVGSRGTTFAACGLILHKTSRSDFPAVSFNRVYPRSSSGRVADSGTVLQEDPGSTPTRYAAERGLGYGGT
jgi:hypothetical protein